MPVRVLPAPAPIGAPVSAPALLAPRAAPLPTGTGPWHWERLAIGAYLAGLLVFSLRLAYSYRVTRQLVRSARPLAQFAPETVAESAAITVPLTLGWRRPKILLPAGWESWPDAKLEAVLAHERTHAARGDWAVALLAGVNRCVFWFHPLAWWLERRLALLAELACDDAALARVASRAAYAEVLVEMAEAVRRGGGRIAWEAMAMARHSEVRLRVDRILDESRQILPGLTRKRWLVLLAGALPLIWLTAAIRPARVRAQQNTPPATPAAQTAPNTSADQPGDTSPDLDAARRRIELLEAQIEQFRTGNPDRLPEQFQANVARLNDYHLMLAEAQEAVSRAQQEKLMLETQLRNNETNLNLHQALADRQAAPERSETVQALTKQIEELRGEMATLSEDLTPNHPARKRVQAALDELQTRLREVQAGGPVSVPGAMGDIRAANAQLRAELQSLNAGMDAKVRQMRDLERQMEAAKSRIEGAPGAEVEYSRLMRERDLAREQYEEIGRAARSPAYTRGPALTYRRDPEYTPEAKSKGIKGVVGLSVTIGADGVPDDIQVIRPLDPGLDAKAIECVRAWRFRPATHDGQPVTAFASVEVKFQ